MRHLEKRHAIALVLLICYAGIVSAASRTVPGGSELDEFLATLEEDECTVSSVSPVPGTGEFLVEFECEDDDPTDALLARLETLRGNLQALIDENQQSTEDANQAIAEIDGLLTDVNNAISAIENAAASGVLDSILAETFAAVAETSVAELEQRAEAVGDPVRLAVGNFVHTETDFAVRVDGLDFQIQRHYDSTWNETGSVGLAWFSSLDTRIIRRAPSRAQEALDAANSWLSFARGVYNDLDGAYDELLGDPDGTNTGTAERSLEEMRDLLDEAEELYQRAQNLERDADGTDAEDDASAFERSARGFRDGASSRESSIDNGIGTLRANRSEIDCILTVEIPAIELEVARTERELAYALHAESANRFVSFAGSPDHYAGGTVGGVTLISTAGSPKLFELDESPDFDSQQTNPDGTANYYPEGSTATPQYRDRDRLELLRDGTWVFTNESGHVHRFDYYGRITSMSDRNGNSVRFAHAGERVTTITDDYGRVFTVSREPNGLITGIDGPQQRTVRFGYDSDGRLVSRTDAGGDTVGYAYDENRLVEMRKPDNTFLRYHYVQRDGDWVVEWTQDETGAREYFRYADAYREFESPSGIVERHFFDPRFRTVRIEYGDGFAVDMK